jgi:hypothetical protein
LARHRTVGAVAERRAFFNKEKFFLHRQPEIGVAGQLAAAVRHIDRID